MFLFWQFDWYISFSLRYFVFFGRIGAPYWISLFFRFSSFSKISSAENTLRASKKLFQFFSNKILILSDNWLLGVLLESVEMTEEKEITNNEENIVKKTVIGSSEAVTASQDYNCKYNYSRVIPNIGVFLKKIIFEWNMSFFGWLISVIASKYGHANDRIETPSSVGQSRGTIGRPHTQDQFVFEQDNWPGATWLA